MTEKEMYNLINSQNNQQSNGFAVNEKERGISGVFSALMRKVLKAPSTARSAGISWVLR